MQPRKLLTLAAPLLFSLSLAACGGGGNNDDEICDDNLDNDANGQTDCDDAACAADPACLVDPEVCDDNLDNDNNAQFDCADAACAADAACTAAADSAAAPIDGLVAAQDSTFANGNAAFEKVTANLGIDVSVFIIAASDQADTCAALTVGAADLKAATLVVIDIGEADPEIAFPLTTPGEAFSVTGDGVNFIVTYGNIVVANNALAAQGGDNGVATVSIDKIGADGLVSVSGDSQLTLEFSDAANFNTDVNGDGTNDAKSITPANISFDVQNGAECPGLAAAFGL